jgi:hypothetical protein
VDSELTLTRLPIGEYIAPRGDSSLGSIYSPMETPCWGTSTLQWRLLVGEMLGYFCNHFTTLLFKSCWAVVRSCRDDFGEVWDCFGGHIMISFRDGVGAFGWESACGVVGIICGAILKYSGGHVERLGVIVGWFGVSFEVMLGYPGV